MLQSPKQWIVDAIRISEYQIHVRLVEVAVLENGAMLCTGRRTPRFGFEVARSDYDKVADRLRRSLELMAAENLYGREPEVFLVAAHIAEILSEELALKELGKDGDGDVKVE